MSKEESGRQQAKLSQAVSFQHQEDSNELYEGENEDEFCTMESIEKSRRYRLLHLRDEEVPEFRSLRMIPAFDEDIPQDIFNVSR